MAVGSWSSCSSSTSSLGSSFDDVVIVKPPDSAAEEEGGGRNAVVKFLCSYGGRILPRHTDGALRYVGGDNRVLSLDRRRLRFHELVRRMSEVCGWEVRQVRCQLPTEDLDALVSVTTDADLASLLDVYDDAAAATHGRRLSPLKIRAFLFAPRTTTPPASPPLLSGGSSSSTSPSASSGARTAATTSSPNAAAAASHVLRRNVSWAAAAPASRWWEQQAAARAVDLQLQRSPPPHCHRHGGARPAHRGWLVHSGSHWQ